MAPSNSTRSSRLTSRTRRQRQSKGRSAPLMLMVDNSTQRKTETETNTNINIQNHQEDQTQQKMGTDTDYHSSSPRSSMLELECLKDHDYGHTKSNSIGDTEKDSDHNDSDSRKNSNSHNRAVENSVNGEATMEITAMDDAPSDPNSNTYLEKIRQKRQQNQLRLDQLGLGELKSTMNKKRTRISSTKSPPSALPVRRSSRKANKPPMYTGDDLDLVNETELRLLSVREKEGRRTGIIPVTKARRVPKKIKRRQYKLGEQISAKKRAEYVNVPHMEWVEDMRRYFHIKLENSQNNVYRTMSVVEKLVLGRGVQHPNTKAWFKKNVKINLSNDFRSMLDEAAEWVYNNGGDKGNGWLIEHPVKKCFVYQQARAENGGAFYSEVKL